MDQQALDRLPPCSLDAERAVIGACIIDRDALTEVTEVLSPDDFYDLNHRDVFDAICTMVRENRPVDLLTLSTELKDRGLYDKLGGQSFLASVIDSVPTAANADYHARIVHEKSLRRRLISAGNTIVRMAYAEDRQVDDILEEAERLIFEVSKQRNEATFQSVAEIMGPTFKRIEEAYQNEGNTITGIETGFAGLDRITGGLQRGALNIIAARPAMGKTALALNIGTNIALNTKLPVLVFSLEMSASQLVQRLLGSQARINIHDLITGGFAQGDWNKLTQAAGDLTKAPLYIDDSSLLTPAELKARARRFSARHGALGLIVVDYLQLMSLSRQTDSKQQEVAEISRNLKAIARELNVPVIALSQLSRAVESRTDRRPQLSDLRDSGAIEQDADVVGLLYRESYYAKDEEQQKDSSAKLDIAKHRSGPTGTVNLVFLREYTRFEDEEFHSFN